MPKSRLRVLALEDRLTPALATWDGGGATNLWSTAANWAGDVLPQPGDDLVFPGNVARFTSVNDLAAGINYGTILLSGNNYRISGNAIGLANGISGTLPTIPANTDVDPVIDLPITLTAEQTFARLGPDLSGGLAVVLSNQVDLNGHNLTLQSENHGGITFLGAIVGHGAITKTGIGGVLFAGINSYDGGSTINDGFVTVNGLIGAVSLENGLTALYGSGTTGPVTNSGGSIFPGSVLLGVEALTTGDFQQSGGSINYFAHSGIPNTVNRLDVHGTVNLSGTLFLSVSNDVMVQPGDSLTLISNDGVDPVVGEFSNAPEGANVFPSGVLALRISYHGGDGNDVVVTAANTPASAVGAGAGAIPLVNVYAVSGKLIHSFLAYDPIFRGGVRVAVADVTGDNNSDIITAPGPGGGPVIRVFDGKSYALVRVFLAYDPAFFGGDFVAAADVNGDGHADIATGAGTGGGPHVKLFDGATGAELSSFMAYNINFRGGVSVAVHERVEFFGPGGFPTIVPGTIVTGAGPGGGPHVRVFDALTAQPKSEFLAFDPQFTGGVNVAVGTPYTSGMEQFGLYGIIAAPASQGPPMVRIVAEDGRLIREFLAFDPGFVGGVTVSTIRLGLNFSPVLLTGAGPGGVPLVNQWQTLSDGNIAMFTLTRSFFAFDPAFTGGVFVG